MGFKKCKLERVSSARTRGMPVPSSKMRITEKLSYYYTIAMAKECNTPIGPHM